MSKKNKTFTLDLNRISRNHWFCGHRACIMGQFAEQFGANLGDKDTPNGVKEDKASTFCNKKLGRCVNELIGVNDSHRPWSKKLPIMRKLLKTKGYTLRVKK